MHLSLLVQQQRTVPGHAYQHVARALFLQSTGSCHDLGVSSQYLAHDLAQLMVVGLDEEGVVGQHVYQKVAGGIYHGAHAPALQPRQQPLVDALRQACRDAACQNKDIALGQLVQLGFQLLQSAFRDGRACAVQLSLLPGLDLDVDAGHAVFQMHKVGLEPLCRQTALQPCAGLPGHKAQCHALAAQLRQHAGHVDALAAQHAILALGAVHCAHLQRCVQTHNVVDGRVKGNGVNHASASFTNVYCLYFGFGQRLVRMAPPCRSVMTAG